LPQSNFSFSKTQYGNTKPSVQWVACFGRFIDEHRLRQLQLKWLIKTYETTTNKAKFFNPFFYKTGRNTKTQQQIEDGKSEADIRELGNRSRKVQKNELNI
jgi:hypothetical protein